MGARRSCREPSAGASCGGWQGLRRQVDEFAALETLDTGKPISQTHGEVEDAASLLEYFSGLTEDAVGSVYPQKPGFFAYSRRQPYGVVGAIAPWNFPLVLACWKTAPALAVGNSVVLKMAEQAPLTTARLGLLAQEAGLPDGVLTSFTVTAPPPAPRWPRTRWCRRSPSPGRPTPAVRSSTPVPSTSRACTWSWAARPPTSSAPTPTSSRRWPGRCSRASSTPGNLHVGVAAAGRPRDRR